MIHAPLRIAMWSGPRNISTAMMRSWGNRVDTAVIDEPFYARYLHETGRKHTGAAEVIAAGETDSKKVIDGVLGSVPHGKPIFYQKHMTHHLLPDMDRQWMRQVSNCFLIRDPRQVIPSLLEHVPDAQLADTGFAQQLEIFQLVREWTGTIPPVIDAMDVLNDPRHMLTRLCEALGVRFTERMLSWAPGLRDTDGPWAKYWYREVQTTTCFRPYQPKDRAVPVEFHGMLQECQQYYQVLHAHRIT